MNELLELRQSLKDRFSALRRLMYIIERPSFDEVYKQLLEDGPLTEKFRQALNECNIGELQRIVNKVMQRDYAAMSLRELRNIARSLGITYYSKMSKEALHSKIIGEVNATKAHVAPDPVTIE